MTQHRAGPERLSQPCSARMSFQKNFKDHRDKYVDEICEKMIPQAAKKKLAQFVDVFCDKGAFTPKESEQSLRSRTTTWFGNPRPHVPTERNSLATVPQIRPASFDHMDHVNRRRHSSSCGTRYRRNAGARRKLFLRTERLSARSPVYRCWQFPLPSPPTTTPAHRPP